MRRLGHQALVLTGIVYLGLSVLGCHASLQFRPVSDPTPEASGAGVWPGARVALMPARVTQRRVSETVRVGDTDRPAYSYFSDSEAAMVLNAIRPLLLRSGYELVDFSAETASQPAADALGGDRAPARLQELRTNHGVDACMFITVETCVSEWFYKWKKVTWMFVVPISYDWVGVPMGRVVLSADILSTKDGSTLWTCRVKRTSEGMLTHPVTVTSSDVTKSPTLREIASLSKVLDTAVADLVAELRKTTVRGTTAP